MNIEASDIVVSVEDDGENSSWMSSYENASPQNKILMRAFATLTAGYLLTTMMPTSLIKWFVVGCAADYCFKAATGGASSLLGMIASEYGGKKNKVMFKDGGKVYRDESDFERISVRDDFSARTPMDDKAEKEFSEHVEDVEKQTKKQHTQGVDKGRATPAPK
jgi:hypothetical protein